jgi:hypothetical protein
MDATMSELALILTVALCAGVLPVQAVPRGSGAVLIGPMDPTVDGDLCLDKDKAAHQARPSVMRRGWTENECGPDARANCPWPTCPDAGLRDRLPSAPAFQSLEISLGTR